MRRATVIRALAEKDILYSFWLFLLLTEIILCILTDSFIFEN
ncbi:hypothetical protein HMPREF0216_00304 [Clostridium celatum DSM 1785]|uniref:Uncharacterized protein n=1 Tax=Clostridium celatum DSM 1785 TaxID=545697 RepID=L1QN49_9CLOT|nr:hypothetical protein HMPREF0216_00304 [Clostridium celatum DSM 1785]